MKSFQVPGIFFFLLTFSISCSESSSGEHVEISKSTMEKAKYAVVIHGGAGTITRENMTAEKELAYQNAMNNALDIAESILSKGGKSIDAVIETIKFLEDSPLFNAGKGAVFTHEGKNEMDASIMEGKNLNAGAIGGVRNIKNPITAARAVMEKSEHVFLTGTGAELFAVQQGLEVVDPSYFYTERRWNALQNVLEAERKEESVDPDQKHGTVGVVALDHSGHIVAGTSTGGMTNKRFNRIGDSPIIGAGTYANNKTCGVSSTGHGEFFIRYAVAHDISALMEYKHLSVEEAAKEVVMKKLVEAGGTGGVVALDGYGNAAMVFNTEGMYRAYSKEGKREIGIYKD